MTVKKLIEKLNKCSPDAVVCIEALDDNAANEVKEYTTYGGNGDSRRFVYIADDLKCIDEMFS